MDKMRNRYAQWICRDGRQMTLAEMDDNHLLNLRNYLLKLLVEDEKAKELANDNNFLVIARRFQGASIDAWIFRIMKEINRRAKERRQDALNVLNEG